MHVRMKLIIWALVGAVVEVCGAPAVSLSFGKSNNDSGAIFVYKNGSWVPLGGNSKIHGSAKSSAQVKKDDRLNLTGELDDLFKRLNMTGSVKSVPNVGGSRASTSGPSEKPLGELFLEWLSKHEGSFKPVAVRSTPIPVVGLQIDFDESPQTKVTARDSARLTSRPKIALVSPVDVSFLLEQPVKKAAKPPEPPAKSRVMKRQENPPADRPVNYYLDSEIGQVSQKASKSNDILKTSYVRKRSDKIDSYEPIKFIIEPLTISPFELVQADLEDVSNYHSGNLTKRNVKPSDLERKPKRSLILSKVRNHTKVDKKTPFLQHLRNARSYVDLLTQSEKALSSRPDAKTLEFDESLPITSHVQKRHGKLFLNAKHREGKNDETVNQLTPVPAAEESYSGQLLVRNEIPGDRKGKLNDLPKYVMKFLSQCKELIEQNYNDDDGGKDNEDDDEALLVDSGRTSSSNEDNRVLSKSATDRIHLVTRHGGGNAEIDEFDSININKRPMRKMTKFDKDKSIRTTLEDADVELDKWAQPDGSMKMANGSIPNPHQSLLNYDGDDSYDEELDWHLGENGQLGADTINRKIFFKSEGNYTSCQPISEDYAPSKDNFPPDCSYDEPLVTTLSSEQWKVLVDMLNERLPSTKSTCATTGAAKKTTTSHTTAATDSDLSVTSKRKTSSSKVKSDSLKNTDTKATTVEHTSRKGTGRSSACTTTCRTTTKPTTTSPSTVCTTPTTTCSTSKSTCSTEPNTCGPEFESDPSTTDDSTEQSTSKHMKQKYKPPLPQRYLIKIETSKPKHYNELSHLQGRSKPNNWFDNIKNLKLLEGLRSNSQNPVKSNNYVLPKSGPLTGPIDPDNPERMIAEGVIPLKTGSTLNLYISYILNKTKAHKGRDQLQMNGYDKLHGTTAPFYDAKVQDETE